MIPEKYRILMNSELDGVITPAERDDLELYFVRHPEARQYFEELRVSLEVLEDMGGVQPPAGLHGRIMRAVERKNISERASWQEIIFGRLRMGYAFSAAIGIMMGFLLHTLIPVDGMGRDLTALELFRGTNTTEQMSGWTRALPVDLAQEGVEGHVHSFQLKDKVLVHFTLRATREVKLGFHFAENAQLQGVHYLANEGFQTVTTCGTLEFEGAGVCQCEFLVDSLDEPGLDLELDPGQGTGTIFRKEISWH